MSRAAQKRALGYRYNFNTVVFQVIGVKVVNDESVVVGLLATIDDDEIVTDSSWKCTAEFHENWASVHYDDSAWAAATELGQAVARVIPVHCLTPESFSANHNFIFCCLTVNKGLFTALVTYPICRLLFNRILCL